MPQEPDELTIAATAARCGLPESTLRYWERIGLVPAVSRDPSSGHRRYTAEEVARLETLANLRAVGLSIEDMRAYLAHDGTASGDASRQRALFQAHADRLTAEIALLQTQLTYLALKVEYWHARERGDEDAAAALATELAPVIRRVNPTAQREPAPRERPQREQDT